MGSSVKFTATVSGPGGTPTGSVTFYDGESSLGSNALVSGIATYTTSALTVGSHSISAAYGGDANYAASTSSTLSQVVGVKRLCIRGWVDTGGCQRDAPCQTFSYALSVTNAGGEINCVDLGGFGTLTINKAITIKCDGYEGGVLASGTDGIVINAASTDVIYLSGLDIEGVNSSLSGVLINTAAKVHIVNCVIRGFTTAGVKFAPSATNVAFDIIDTVIANNPGTGVFVKPIGSTSVRGFLNRTRVTNSGSDGIFVNANATTGGTKIAVRDSEFANNTGNGFGVFSNGSVAQIQIDSSKASNNSTGIAATGTNAVVRFTRSTITANGTGANQSSGGSVLSYMTNSIDGNGSPGSYGTTPQH